MCMKEYNLWVDRYIVIYMCLLNIRSGQIWYRDPSKYDDSNMNRALIYNRYISQRFIVVSHLHFIYYIANGQSVNM